jgi:hypothetical protein
MSELLCSYIPVDIMDYHLECLLINGWRHMHQLILSYIDKRLDAI